MPSGSQAVKRRSAAAAAAAAAARRSPQVDMHLVEPSAIPLIDDDERYTTRETIAWCMAKAGVDRYDLDVAACEESHKADIFFDHRADGLVMPWAGNVWCNPPFSDLASWVAKAWVEWHSGACHSISMLLPACRCEQKWWQDLVEPSRDRGRALRTHFLPGRTRFGIPGNPEGVGVGSPPFGCALLVWKTPMFGETL